MLFATALARTALAVPFLCFSFAQNETPPHDLPLNVAVQIRLDDNQPVPGRSWRKPVNMFAWSCSPKEFRLEYGCCRPRAKR